MDVTEGAHWPGVRGTGACSDVHAGSPAGSLIWLKTQRQANRIEGHMGVPILGVNIAVLPEMPRDILIRGRYCPEMLLRAVPALGT